MTMLSTGGGLLLLFLLCSKVNKLTTVDFVARLFEPVVVMRLVAILSENKCCQAEESSCPAGCFCATKRGDHLPPDLVCQKKKKPVSVVTALYIFWLQDGLRIQCVLMVNAKLDPEELPQNTLQVQTNIFIKSVNKAQIKFVNKN